MSYLKLRKVPFSHIDQKFRLVDLFKIKTQDTEEPINKIFIVTQKTIISVSWSFTFSPISYFIRKI